MDSLKVRRISYAMMEPVRNPGEPFGVNGEFRRFDPTGDYIPDKFVDVIENTGSGLVEHARRQGQIIPRTQVIPLSAFDKKTLRVLKRELGYRIEKHAKKIKQEEGWI